ncbi:class F sortase [Actinomadura xylanilytica]|uniref:class F sortase n=1 Tax=Actinomadura xylanilytica TaxID=887459 RepID=UPI00255AB81E|nr:class F sortase [Actinomadura xylanilytica]MDL4774835.1 class F sortase [Actinomadura xylanilytica]
MPGDTSASAGRRVLGAAAGVLLGGLLLGGCGGGNTAGSAPPTAPGSSSAPVPARASASAPAAQVTYAQPMGRSLPKSIRIPKIGVSAPVSQLGLKADGTIQEPPLSRPNLAGWYEQGPTPGEEGPSVVLGHVDANKRAAVFFKLKELKKGDRIEVTRQDGSVATFAVQGMEDVPKKSFPGEKVYAEDLDYAALRLVTCGGAFDAGTGHYVNNTIAYARLVDAT